MIWELCKKIGINTFGDLQRFKKECMKNETDVEVALLKYLSKLGKEFKINETNL